MASLNREGGNCTEDFKAAGMVEKYYTLGLFMGQYAVPLIIIAFAYMEKSKIVEDLGKILLKQDFANT